MTVQIPKRLGKEPLIEAIWQVRFDPPDNQPIGDILPGILFSALRNDQPSLQLKRLPVADIPPAIARGDANLRYAAKYRIETPQGSLLYHIGDRVVALNCRRPYVGWNNFRNHIEKLIELLDRSGLLPTPQRHSLRYIDLLTIEPPPSLGSLQVALRVGEHSIQGNPLQLRVELPKEQCIHILQIATPAQVRLPDGEQTGTLIDLETLATVQESNWPAVRDSLETLHAQSKGMFFGSVLTADAIQQMAPEY